MSNLQYKKRRGTSGVSGQLYETKLLSLILFRLTHDEEIQDFHMGTNVDALGEFDDICLKFKTKHNKKPTAVFLQAKHREDQNRCLVVTKTDLTKYFDSYLKIRNKFDVNSTDAIFRGKYEDLNCAFVYYTNTRNALDNVQEENTVINKINYIIGTGDVACSLNYTNDEIELLNKLVLNEKIGKLATIVADIVLDKNYDYNTIMEKELVKTYHVILRQKVFKLSSIRENFRTATVGDEFFKSNDEHILLFKNKLIMNVLKENKLSYEETRECLSSLCYAPIRRNIAKLIGSVIVYKNNMFQFVDKLWQDDVEFKDKLEKVTVTQSLVEEAIEMGGKMRLQSKQFKLPLTFGNIDMTLRGDESKREQRLNYLATKIIELLNDSDDYKVDDTTFKVVDIDNSFSDKGFIKANGGLASAVGNLLVLDDKTKYLMFNNVDNLKGHAQKLLEKISTQVKDLEKCRFNVKIEGFPRLEFDCNDHDKGMVADFKKRILFYTNQARESEVENILKRDISRLQNAREQCDFQIQSDAILRTYHDEIQKWWITQDTAKYLTKSCKIYQNATKGYISNPLLSIANALNKHGITKHSLTFDLRHVDALKLNELHSRITVIVSEVIVLSVIKLTQHFKATEYVLIDLNYILYLPTDDCDQLDTEMRLNNDKIFILTCNTITKVLKPNREIKDIIQILNGKKIILVTNVNIVEQVIQHFRQSEIDIRHDKINLINLTDESQTRILENTIVLFQDVPVTLNLLLDDNSKAFIKGEYMNKIINGERIVLGDTLTNANYEETKQFYVNRKVLKKYVFERPGQYDEYATDEPRGMDEDFIAIPVNTFFDVDDRAVLVTAEPGMGKSSLLTHLSLKTKERDPKVWIIRINLLDYSRYFYQWKENKVKIDLLEALKFICIAMNKKQTEDYLIIDEIKLKETNSGIVLDVHTEIKDPKVMFEINMFLHYYNNYDVIFLFDGFDEICPHYEGVVIAFLKVIKENNILKHLIWVTSRAYNEILIKLEKEFGYAYPLQPFSSDDQEVFVERFLQNKLNLTELNARQINKINEFIIFMEESHSWRPEENFEVLYKCQSLPLHIVYLDAAQYFKNEIRRILYLAGKEQYVKAWDINVTAMKIVRQYNGTRRDVSDMTKFITIPLHIYMVVDYFQNEIKDTEHETKWDLNISTFAMYERFIDTKLKKIRFEDKNRMDLYRPDVQFTFERERKEFVNKHKKLAAYALFLHSADKLFSETEIKEIKDAMNSIKHGEEKTGVIYVVIDDVPSFVHFTFAEYFAVEYLSDLIKNTNSEEKVKKLWDFLLNDMFFENNIGVLNILDNKLVTDEEVRDIVNSESNKRIIFDILMVQCAGTMEYVYDSSSYEDVSLVKKYYSSLHKALSESLSNMTSLFLSTLEFINKDNLTDFIKFTAENSLIQDAVIIKNFDFTEIVLNTVRNIDENQLGDLFKRGFGHRYKGTNKEIIEKFTKDLYEDLNSRELYDSPYQMLESLATYYKYYG